MYRKLAIVVTYYYVCTTVLYCWKERNAKKLQVVGIYTESNHLKSSTKRGFQFYIKMCIRMNLERQQY